MNPTPITPDDEAEFMERDMRWMIHLNWMVENQPDLLWELHQQGKLARHLDKKMDSGLELTLRLKDRGMTEEESFEVATNEILAPSDGPAFGDNPPAPLQAERRRQVFEGLELL